MSKLSESELKRRSNLLDHMLTHVGNSRAECEHALSMTGWVCDSWAIGYLYQNDRLVVKKRSNHV